MALVCMFVLYNASLQAAYMGRRRFCDGFAYIHPSIWSCYPWHGGPNDACCCCCCPATESLAEWTPCLKPWIYE
jgi:hypothetical protein